MILPGSYANGFAPRDGQPLYPELWKGCVGAWAPCLGPTGLTLRDWGGTNYHGDLINGPLWTPRDGRYSVELDGSNDRVEITNPQRLRNQDFSLSLWVRLKTQTNAIANLVDFSHANLQGWTLQSVNATTSSQYQFAWYTGSGFVGLASPGVTIPIGVMTHICCVKSGGSAFGYVNGVLTQSATGLTSTVFYDSSNRNLAFGNYTFGAGRNVACYLQEVSVHNRPLSPNEVKTLASRRGIAYELAPRRRSSVQVASFNRRRRLLLGAS